MFPSKRASATCLLSAEKRLNAMSGFANEGMMIPEQVWDKPDSVFSFGDVRVQQLHWRGRWLNISG